MSFRKIDADGGCKPHRLLFSEQQLCLIGDVNHFRWGRRARAAGSECCSLSLERLCPNVYTIHIVKEQTEAQKNPGGVNRPGSLCLELPWKVRNSSLPRIVQGRLIHRFPTNRGERIKTVKRRIRRYCEQAYAAVSVGIWLCMPTPDGGSR